MGTALQREKCLACERKGVQSLHPYAVKKHFGTCPNKPQPKGMFQKSELLLRFVCRLQRPQEATAFVKPQRLTFLPEITVSGLHMKQISVLAVK